MQLVAILIRWTIWDLSTCPTASDRLVACTVTGVLIECDSACLKLWTCCISHTCFSSLQGSPHFPVRTFNTPCEGLDVPQKVLSLRWLDYCLTVLIAFSYPLEHFYFVVVCFPIKGLFFCSKKLLWSLLLGSAHHQCLTRYPLLT